MPPEARQKLLESIKQFGLPTKRRGSPRDSKLKMEFSVDEARVRTAFLQYVVDLMRGYRDYISWDEGCGSFNFREFLKSRAEFAAAPYFFHRFHGSQMLQMFIQRRFDFMKSAHKRIKKDKKDGGSVHLAEVQSRYHNGVGIREKAEESSENPVGILRNRSLVERYEMKEIETSQSKPLKLVRIRHLKRNGTWLNGWIRAEFLQDLVEDQLDVDEQTNELLFFDQLLEKPRSIEAANIFTKHFTPFNIDFPTKTIPPLTESDYTLAKQLSGFGTDDEMAFPIIPSSISTSGIAPPAPKYTAHPLSSSLSRQIDTNGSASEGVVQFPTEAQLKFAGLIKDRRVMMKLHKQCFYGKEVVEWMVKTGLASNATEAVEAGKHLQKRGMLHAVKRAWDIQINFSQSMMLFQFYGLHESNYTIGSPFDQDRLLDLFRQINRDRREGDNYEEKYYGRLKKRLKAHLGKKLSRKEKLKIRHFLRKRQRLDQSLEIKTLSDKRCVICTAAFGHGYKRWICTGKCGRTFCLACATDHGLVELGEPICDTCRPGAGEGYHRFRKHSKFCFANVQSPYVSKVGVRVLPLKRQPIYNGDVANGTRVAVSFQTQAVDDQLLKFMRVHNLDLNPNTWDVGYLRCDYLQNVSNIVEVPVTHDSIPFTPWKSPAKLLVSLMQFHKTARFRAKLYLGSSLHEGSSDKGVVGVVRWQDTAAAVFPTLLIPPHHYERSLELVLVLIVFVGDRVCGSCRIIVSFTRDSETHRVELVETNQSQDIAVAARGMVTVHTQWIDGAPGSSADACLLRDDAAMQHPHARTVINNMLSNSQPESNFTLTATGTVT